MKSSHYSQGKPFPQLHGGVNTRELHALGLKPSDIVDFSVNLNPLGPPPGIAKALRAYDPSQYPDPEGWELREALAHRFGVAVEKILVGNGATELIHLLARALLRKGDKAAILTPTFGEYEAACRKEKAQLHFCSAEEEVDFRWDIERGVGFLRQLHPTLVWLCNPNNPTGVYMSQKDVIALLQGSAEGWFIIDEAFLPFVGEPWNSLSLLKNPRVILLRSMTKDYALAGLRLGYLIADEDVVRTVKSVQPPWSINGAALAAGIAALQDTQHLTKTRECISQAKEFLVRELTRLGLWVVPSDANFLLVQVKNASEVRVRLVRKGIHVRDCTSFGLPDFIRLGVRTLPECQRLVQVLEEERIGGNPSAS